MCSMRLAFLSHHNPLNRNSFSGTAHFMYHALTERADVDILGRGIHTARSGIFSRLKTAAGRKFLGIKDFDAVRRRHALGKAAAAALQDGRYDAAICLTSSGLLAGMDPTISTPLLHLTDATPGYIAEEYGLPPKPGAVRTERAAITRASAVIYSSDYMAERSIVEFGAEIAPKLRVVPFGLNMDAPPKPVFDIDLPGTSPRLVFIGKKWQRKGGDIALETLRWLRARGLAAELTVIGSRLPDGDGLGTGEDGLTVIPFLDKDRAEDAAQFDRILGHAHALILPTRADCTPMVIAEANAFGVPVLATEVGGLRSLVTPGRNGWLFAPKDRADAFGQRILDLCADPGDYLALRRQAYETYRNRLTWTAWSESMLKIVAELADTPRQRRKNP